MGIRLGFRVGRVKGRSPQCLYLILPAGVMPLAYFVSDEAADFFSECEPSLARLDETVRRHWGDRYDS